jgi:hypothetical protein
MTDSLLTPQDREEALSRSYAYVVAKLAGYATAEYDMDRDGVDFRIQASGDMRPAIELQLKATINLGDPRDGYFRFPLKVRNYDLLRIETQTPRLLLLLDLPSDKRDWVTITADELVIRRRAYWVNLKGYEETTNRTSVTVPIPKGNLFNVESLRDLMDQSRKGKIQ